MATKYIYIDVIKCKSVVVRFTQTKKLYTTKKKLLVFIYNEKTLFSVGLMLFSLLEKNLSHYTLYINKAKNIYIPKYIH